MMRAVLAKIVSLHPGLCQEANTHAAGAAVIVGTLCVHAQETKAFAGRTTNLQVLEHLGQVARLLDSCRCGSVLAVRHEAVHVGLHGLRSKRGLQLRDRAVHPRSNRKVSHGVAFLPATRHPARDDEQDEHSLPKLADVVLFLRFRHVFILRAHEADIAGRGVAGVDAAPDG